MARCQRIILTTTSSLDGWWIEEHLGPLFAHLVIGTGLFAHVFSTFTDFFGSHSRSYQNKLDSINQGAMAIIESQATLLGADAVVGLRVDHDEISGGGKSMLMVTASGTAVRARRLEPANGRYEIEHAAEKISASGLKVLLRRQALREQVEAGTLNWDAEENWRFIIENSMEELAPYVLV